MGKKRGRSGLGAGRKPAACGGNGMCYVRYYFSERIIVFFIINQRILLSVVAVFFSHNKSANSTFYHDFSANSIIPNLSSCQRQRGDLLYFSWQCWLIQSRSSITAVAVNNTGSDAMRRRQATTWFGFQVAPCGAAPPTARLVHLRPR